MPSTRFGHGLLWIGRLTFAVALLNAGAALLSHWAVNAEGLGAHDLGIALSLSFGGALSLIASFYAAPVLALFAAASALVHRPAALWFLGAAIVSGVPLAVLSLLGN